MSIYCRQIQINSSLDSVADNDMKFPLPRFTCLMGAAFVVCCIAFTAFPQLDLKVSNLFFDNTHGFVINQVPEIAFLHRLINDLGQIIAAALLILCVVSMIPRISPGLIAHRRAIIFLLLTLTLGPGLIVNRGFKTYWGRARPQHVEVFGGSKQFTPALQPTNQTNRNGSFVSGHAALGFWLLTPAFISSYKKFWLSLGIITGGLIGLIRIAQGGHFLSDVLFAFFAVYFTAAGLYWCLSGIQLPRASHK